MSARQASRNEALRKAKVHRPIGYISPGGFQKTASGWRKVSGKGGASVTKKKIEAQPKRQSVSGAIKGSSLTRKPDPKERAHIKQLFSDKSIAEEHRHIDKMFKKTSSALKQTIGKKKASVTKESVVAKPKEKKKLATTPTKGLYITPGGFVKTDKGWRKATKAQRVEFERQQKGQAREQSQKKELVVKRKTAADRFDEWMAEEN